MGDLGELAREFFDFAKTEPVGPRKDRVRASATMTSIRRAVEGFVAAVAQSRLELNALPEDFITEHWLPTQASVLKQPIQLRVRMSGVKQFLRWMASRGVAVSGLSFPQIDTSTPKKKDPPMTTDFSHLSDAAQMDPVPASNSTPAMQLQATVPPPPPQPQPRPAQTQKRNPLQAMLPQPGFKLRVRRERDDGESVYIGDFNSELVTATGSVEAFLQKAITPRLVAAGLVGDVTMLVSPLTPATPTAGPQEGEMRRITITITGAPPVQSPPTQLISAMPSGNDAHDAVRHTISAQEQIADRVEKAVEKVTRSNAPQNNEEMSEMRSAITTLTTSVAMLADKIASMQSAPRYDPAPAANETLGIIREVATLFKQPQSAPAAPPQSIEGIFNVMAKAKEVFQPRDVNIDVSPLEERIEKLAYQMNKKDDLIESLERLTKLKTFFQADGSVTSAPRPSGLWGALGEFATTLVSNPEPMAMAAERVLNALARVRGGEAPPPPSEPKPQLPPPLLEATKSLLGAEGPEAVATAAHAWVGQLQQTPQTTKAAERIIMLVRDGQGAQLAIVLQSVVAALGFKEQATPNRMGAIAKSVISSFQKSNAAQEAEESDDDGEGEDDGTPADLNIRVGGAHAEGDEEGDDESDDEESDDESEGTDESPEDVMPTEDEVAEVLAAEPEPKPEPRRRRARKQPQEVEVLEVPPQPPADEPEVVPEA